MMMNSPDLKTLTDGHSQS